MHSFNSSAFKDTCVRRFFFDRSFDIYGGVAGLYDYGPVMCSINNNFLSEWRHFFIRDNINEIETTAMTPEAVFVSSGHVEKFNDIMCKDVVTGECLRVDKYLETVFEALYAKTPTAEYKQLIIDLGSMKLDALKEVIDRYQIKSPEGNDLSKPFPVNLMFQTQIGMDTTKIGYLRPELAQGIFMNYKRALDTHTAKGIPFGLASIGRSFRNEIAPRNSLLRVREFTLAEIEYFIDPQNKYHHKYDTIKDITILAWNRSYQELGLEPEITKIVDLVDQKIIDNQVLAYFMGKTLLFLNTMGLKYLRFRQHRVDEMAHYAQDCWDVECLTSYGWIECVGIADRSTYDLGCHIKGTHQKLYAYRPLQTSITIQKTKVIPNKSLIGKTFTSEAPLIIKTLEQCKMPPTTLTVNDKDYKITPEMYNVQTIEKVKTKEKYIPNVIEPSFGVGRLLFACLEQNYWLRSDNKRAVISLGPRLAYKQVAVVSISTNEAFDLRIDNICDELQRRHVSYYTDNSKISIGKKYARMDEIGVPFCLTLDFEEDQAITVRERDNMKQVRIPMTKIYQVMVDLCCGMMSFEEL
jgi:glycyl-tRNA synthetase